MKRDVKTILFFLANGNLTKEAEAEAKAIEKASDENRVVKFRNGSVPVTGKLELCDYVAGEPIPAEYAQTYRTANADGSSNEPYRQGTAETDTATTGEVPQGGAQVDPLAQEVGSVGGPGGWGGSQT